jgi:predicted metal-dependent hydrolase
VVFLFGKLYNAYMPNISLAYTIRRHPRAKNVRILVKPDATVVVSAPKRVSKKFIDLFVKEHQPWVLGEIKKISIRTVSWESPLGISQESYQSCKARSLKFVRDRLRYYGKHYGYTYNRVSIKNMSSRWGSCSSEGNMSFHYRLLFLPLELADYVIVHELCHLAELNHSNRFWQLVRQTIPNYRKCKKALEEYGI